jgi:hypothetical protein
VDDCIIEDHLLISCPGGKGIGGLAYLEEKGVAVVSAFSSTGICFGETVFVWALQDDGGRCLLESRNGSPRRIEISTGPVDIHDVLLAGERMYLAASQHNAVMCLDGDYNCIEKWQLPGEEDSSHLNSVALYQGRLLASVFGRFTKHREYKEGTRGRGQIIDIRSGEVMLDGLSQPHSLTVDGDLLYFCGSEDKMLYVYDGWRLVSSVALPGYARGIAVGENFIYVGISLSRNVEHEQHELASGAVAVIDRKTMAFTGVREIPFREIYDLRIIHRHIDLIALLAAQEGLNRLAAEKGQQAEVYNQALAECTAKVQDLELLLAERNQQIAEITGGGFWRLTGPVRSLARFFHKRNS